MTHSEAEIKHWRGLRSLALDLEQTGRIHGSTREHLKRIRALLLMESRMVDRAEVGDKPELLWP